MKSAIIFVIAVVAGCCQAGRVPLPPGVTGKPPITTCMGTPTGEPEREFNLGEKWSEMRDEVYPHTCQCVMASDLFWRGTDDATSFCQLKGCRAYTGSGEEFVPPNENQHGCSCVLGGGHRIADAPQKLYGCDLKLMPEVVSSEQDEDESVAED